MKKDLHKIDKLFLTQLEHYEEQPPKNIWLAIENSLNKNETDKYRNRYNGLLKTMICFFLLSLSLLLNDMIQKPARNYNKIGVLTMEKKLEKNSLKETLINKSSGNEHTKLTKMSFKDEQRYVNQNAQDDPSFFVSNHFSKDGETGRHYEIVPIRKNTTSDSLDNTSQKKIPGIASAIQQDNFRHLPNSSGNQTSSEIRLTKAHRLSVLPFFSFDYLCNRLQEVYKYGNENEQDIAGRQNDDMSYTFGLITEYRVTKKWSLQSGISMSNSFTSVSPTVVNAVKDNGGMYKFKLVTTYGLGEITKTGITNPQNGDSIMVTEASLHVQYLTLPVLAKYELKPGKFSVHAVAGFGINRIVNERMEVDYKTHNNSSNDETESIQKIEGLKKAFITGIAGAEATYPLNNNISVGLNPILRYSFTPVNQGTPIKLYPVNIGLAASVKIKL